MRFALSSATCIDSVATAMSLRERDLQFPASAEGDAVIVEELETE